MNNNSGINHLARVLFNRSQNEREAFSTMVLDFGVIQSDFSLLTNTFPHAIPQSDYLITKRLTRPYVIGETTEPALQAGDHVIVAWIQNDAVVIDVIFPADTIG